MKPKFFVVSGDGYILPFEYNSYEAACANCDANEVVYMAENLEELELCLNSTVQD